LFRPDAWRPGAAKKPVNFREQAGVLAVKFSSKKQR
jgi:hypothetical protein